MSDHYNKFCPIHGDKKREDDGDHYWYVCEPCVDKNETCFKCLKPIKEGEGRYRLASGTLCEPCGESAISIDSDGYL